MDLLERRGDVVTMLLFAEYRVAPAHDFQSARKLQEGPPKTTGVGQGECASRRADGASCDRPEVALPADGHVVGEPITITSIRCPGSPRIGLLATCQCGGRTYVVSLAAAEAGNRWEELEGDP